MTPLDAVLRAIQKDPDDDAAHLVYADLLEEAGDTGRAEFIRVQLALAGWDCPVCRTAGAVRFGGAAARRLSCDCGYARLRRRAGELGAQILR